jgi:regulator of protease activity HflC (stomatin/prohibitin superfamily)
MADHSKQRGEESEHAGEASTPPGTPPEPESQEEEDALGAAPTEPAAKKRRLRLPRRGDESKTPPRLPIKRGGVVILVLVLVPILVVALFPVVAGAFQKTPTDKFGISYGGGPFEGRHFQRVVEPGSGLFFNGWFDEFYLYPADQRNYIVSSVKGQGSTQRSDAIVAASRDRVPVTYQVAVYFKLDSDRLRDFHEQLGLKYKAYTSEGWERLIQDTFRQQIENTLQAETRRYDVADIYANADLLAQIQSEAQRSLKERLVRALGEDYFCGPKFTPGGNCTEPTFVIKNADIPKDLVNAFQDNRTSEVQILTKQNEIEQRQAEAQAIAALNISGQDYVLLRGVESGQIKFWVVPSNNGLTLQSPADGSAPSATPPTSTPPPSTTAPRGSNSGRSR